ncbi:MAG: hypothetical protein NC099_00510 [Corallococcus sp.]|nr:hypothetical protein [Corallococcus sp.]
MGTLVSTDGISARATGNTVTKVHICADQATNSYGSKAYNADAIAGRVLHEGSILSVVEGNESSEVTYDYIQAEA